jgi:hypothetical protein
MCREQRIKCGSCKQETRELVSCDYNSRTNPDMLKCITEVVIPRAFLPVMIDGCPLCINPRKNKHNTKGPCSCTKCQLSVDTKPSGLNDDRVLARVRAISQNLPRNVAGESMPLRQPGFAFSTREKCTSEGFTDNFSSFQTSNPMATTTATETKREPALSEGEKLKVSRIVKNPPTGEVKMTLNNIKQGCTYKSFQCTGYFRYYIFPQLLGPQHIRNSDPILDEDVD